MREMGDRKSCRDASVFVEKEQVCKRGGICTGDEIWKNQSASIQANRSWN